MRDLRHLDHKLADDSADAADVIVARSGRDPTIDVGEGCRPWKEGQAGAGRDSSADRRVAETGHLEVRDRLTVPRRLHRDDDLPLARPFVEVAKRFNDPSQREAPINLGPQLARGDQFS